MAVKAIPASTRDLRNFLLLQATDAFSPISVPLKAQRGDETQQFSSLNAELGLVTIQKTHS
jgi:hypothetical protein